MERLIEKPDEITDTLKRVLVNQSLFQSNELEELLSIRDQFVDTAKKDIRGTCYLVNYQEKKLNIFDTYSGEEFHSIDLPGQPTDFNPHDFTAWGNSFLILDPVEMPKENYIPYDLEGNYGIVITGNTSYLYNPGLNSQKLLGLTKQYIFGGIPKKTNYNLPYDMYFSNDYSLMCLTNRDQGKIYLFDIKSAKFTDEITVRHHGSNKAINLAISMDNKKIYITDNLTPYIYIYDLESKTLSNRTLHMGILGNLCLAPDEKSIYMLTIKPEHYLKNLEIETFSEIKSFHTKGELFSTGDVPCDLLVLSNYNKNIFSMTFINEPEPFTPVITIIDTEKNKVIKRFSIKNSLKPVNLCCLDINPIGFVNLTLEELLIENGLLSINKLRDIKYAILKGKEDELLMEEDDYQTFLQVEEEPLEFEVRHDEITARAHGGYFPKKVNRVIIPVDANKFIIELLISNFRQKHQIDLGEIPEITYKLEKVAEQARRKLEENNLEIIEIPGFYNKKQGLDSIIQREFILDMLEEEENQVINTVPDNCPNCKVPLLGSWDCYTCGFTLEKPDDIYKRKVASVDPLNYLPKGNFLVLDQRNNMLFETNQDKVQVWKISGDEIGLKSITSALRLGNLNTLILDEESGAIVEVNPMGEILKKIAVEESVKSFHNPSGFTMVKPSYLLIADTKNHRVLELDLDGNINWQYGKFDEEGINENYLDYPVYIQKTYEGTYLITDMGNNRILEMNRYISADSGLFKMKIDWKYGNDLNIIGGGSGSAENQLNHPLMALREISGNTIILDSGNKRLIEVNPEKQIIWQYNTETDEESSSISFPVSFTRLINKDILIIGNGKYVQIMPAANNRIVWASNFEELYSSSKFRVLKENVTKTKVKYGVSSPYTHISNEPDTDIPKISA